MAHKIGFGYDIHRLVEGRALVIGGIEIPYTKGLKGHSDADVLLHAICDALLGAIADGDIGEHFPDTDPAYKDIPSTELLKKVMHVVKRWGFKVSHIDTVIVLEEPSLAPFKKKIQENIARVLEVNKGCVSVKAKTNEGLGEIGKKEAAACFATVLLE